MTSAPGALERDRAPFHLLSAEEWAEVSGAVSEARFGPLDVIIDRWTSPRLFFVLTAGQVEEQDGTGAVARYGPGDAFDLASLLEGRANSTFVARDPSICLTIPVAVLTAVMRQNRAFRDHLRGALNETAHRLVEARQRREAGAFLLAPVGNGPLHAPVFVSPKMTAGNALAEMKRRNASCVLTRRDGVVGIFTSRDAREKLILARQPETTPVGDLATYGLVTLDRNDPVFDALAAMTRHAIRHVVITSEGEICGVFEQDDLLTLITGSTFAIASQVERARQRDELEAAGRAVPQLIKRLFEQGTRTRHIARVASDLNRKLFQRLYEELIPSHLRDNACLLMLGSEGRGEQLLRTDQDNGIIFREPVDRAEIGEPLSHFTEALLKLGYPPCEGGVMVSNPAWSKDLAQFQRDVRAWTGEADMAGLMNLAILYDASAVAGDFSLLETLKDYLMARLRTGGPHLGYFARPVLNFDTPLGMFRRFRTSREAAHRGAIDIKKGGLFAIVHGVRSLALEHGIRETNTVARIQILRTQGVLAGTLAADLVEAFDFMSMLRLRRHIANLDREELPDNYIKISELTGIERNILRLAFEQVDELKKFLKYHFRLYLVS